MVTVPTLFAVTLPCWSTSAIAGLVDAQVMDLSVALAGRTVAVRCSDEPTRKLNDDLSNITDSTGITSGVLSTTVTSQVAFLPPSLVVTVMVAAPTLLAVTLPDWSTSATEGLEDVHTTEMSAAFAGRTVAVRVNRPSGYKEACVLSSETLSTDTTGLPVTARTGQPRNLTLPSTTSSLLYVFRFQASEALSALTDDVQ